MEVFYLAFNQMLSMFVFIMIGFCLKKAKILPDRSDVIMSRLETYIFVPMLNLNVWMRNCTIETLKDNYQLIVFGLVLIFGVILFSYPISGLFVKNSKNNPKQEYLKNIYKYSITFANTGYVGTVIVLGIWGEEMFFKFSMLTLGIELLCSSWGMFILIPQKEGEVSQLKNAMYRILSPPMISLLIGLIAGLLNVQRYIPDFVMNVLSDGVACMGPVAMVLAGFVMGGYKIKEQLTDGKAYIMTALRLIIIPLIIVVALKKFGINKEILTLVLIAFATPIGLNTVVFPAAYGGDIKPGVSMVMISHALSVITLPLMYLILVGMM